MVVADLRGTDISNGTSSDTRKPERRARTGHTLRAGEISTTPPKCIGTFSKHRGRVSRGTSSASATIRHVAAIKGKFRIGGILWRFHAPLPSFSHVPVSTLIYQRCFVAMDRHPKPNIVRRLLKDPVMPCSPSCRLRAAERSSLSVKADRASLFPKLSRPRR